MGEKEAPDRMADPEPNAIGVPSAELSLGWMLASRANLRFTRRAVDTGIASAKQDQPRVAGQEGWQKCSLVVRFTNNVVVSLDLWYKEVNPPKNSARKGSRYARSAARSL